MSSKTAIFATLIIFLSGSQAPAQTHQATLYTIGPGDELFTKFGHAALCVTLNGRPPTLCFNYGTTDFSRPVGLTADVLLGRAEFYVSVVEERDMLDSFRAQDRTIYRQALPLSDTEVMRLAQDLDEDVRPENRAYIYDHFLDNCSTKPRDLIDGVTDGALRAMARGESVTYRKLVDERLGFSALLVSAADFGLGRRLDVEITPYEAMFLPRHLREAVSHQLGSEPVVVYERQAPLPPVRSREARRRTWLLLLGLALAAVLAILKGSARTATAARTAVGLVFGGLGSLLLLMAIVSPEPEIRFNENLLIFLPTDLVFATGRRKLFGSYAWLRLGVLSLVGVLTAAGIFLQPIWPLWCAAVISTAAIALRKGEPKDPASS